MRSTTEDTNSVKIKIKLLKCTIDDTNYITTKYILTAYVLIWPRKLWSVVELSPNLDMIIFSK